MNPYCAPVSNSCDPLSEPRASRGAGRFTIWTVLSPAVTFPACFLATAGIVQTLYENPASGLAYAKSLVFDFPSMLLALVFSYTILRAILVWCSLRLSVWLSFASAPFSFILFPVYFSPIATLVDLRQNEHLGLLMMGVTPACAGLTFESIGFLAIRTGKQLAVRRIVG